MKVQLASICHGYCLYKLLDERPLYFKRSLNYENFLTLLLGRGREGAEPVRTNSAEAV